MKILGIETSTRTGSVAVTEEKKVIAEYTLNIEETHTARLMPAIDRVLKDTHLTINQIDAVAVSLGPGSFTGLRIGLATAKGLCLSLHKPLRGIPTLDAFARNICFSSHLICPLMDAKKGQVYTALYRSPDTSSSWRKLTDCQALSPEELLSQIEDATVFLGDIPLNFRTFIEEKFKGKFCFAPPHLNFPRAANVALLGADKLEAGEITDLNKVEPLYIRRPEAEEKWEKNHR